jgi:hypothetical protein
MDGDTSARTAGRPPDYGPHDAKEDRGVIIEAVDPKNGQPVRLQCQAESDDDIRDLLSFSLDEAALKKKLQALPISADAKSILFTIAKKTVTVGSFVVLLGRKVLDVIIRLLESFPMASTGLIFGAVLGYLVSNIPVIGLLFGPFVGALATALGFAFGAAQDFGNLALERRIKSALAEFDGLRASSVHD